MKLFVRSFSYRCFLFVAVAGYSASLFGQQNDGAAFRILKDSERKLVSAEYYNASSVDWALRQQTVSRDEFVSFAKLREIADLKRVVVPYGSKLAEKDIKRLAALANLTEIEIGFPGVDSEFVSLDCELKPLSKLQHLEILRLNKNRICDDDLKFIADLPRLKILELNAGGSRKTASTCTDSCAAFLCQAEKLESLIIFGGCFSDKFVDEVTKSLPDIKELALNSDALTDDTLGLIAQRCQKLERLRLVSDQITKAGVKQLENLELDELSINSRGNNDNSY